MALGEGTYCRGVDVYNLCISDETAVSVTTYVGHSTATGPKVAISKKNHVNDEVETSEQVIGTIDASIYRKNSNQDNSKYIIRKNKREKTMEKAKPLDIIEKAIGNGKDVIGIITLTGVILKIVSEGTLTIEEAEEALCKLRSKLERKDCMQDPADGETQNSVAIIDGESEEEICIVRRLTPTETARLQGFPDDYTKIDGVETSDAPQFKSHGNSWATPCANFVSARAELALRELGYVGTINYATCCSGIEAHSVAVRNLDWKAMFFSEIEPFPCRVLAAHYPNVPNLGDMTQIHLDGEKGVITNSHAEGEDYSLPTCFKEAPIQEIAFKDGDLQVFSGGTPCQDISVAGKRRGMAENSGSRSSLAFHFQRIIDECKPTFTIWENVPGAFSSNGGADFVWFVNKCAESGYSMAWRVLDAQYTMTEEFPRAVPQRRRRIWLVGFRGTDWRIPARIVFEKNRDLTENPPERVSVIGFKDINPYVDVNEIRKEHESGKAKKVCDDLFAMMEDNTPKAKKVAQMISIDEFPNEPDFSKVRMVDVFEFAKKVGEPGYLGDVFRNDKKTALIAFARSPEYKEDYEWQESEEAQKLLDGFMEEERNGKLQWEGAERIAPQILENIGNAGILSNGRILTMNCHEWTSGIQLSPQTYRAWEVIMQNNDWMKANDLLPKAYDETVCGLSDVLEENPDEKYNLSWRACFGILRRAETRGKKLPSALYLALISMIRINAGIVKWVALYGKDTKKKETDISERESARACFDRFISQVATFEEVEPVPPKRKNEDESVDLDDEGEFDVDEDGNPILAEEEFEISDKEKIGMEGGAVPHLNGAMAEQIPDLPNGCINVSGGETAATLIASGDAAVGTTQDANVIALKKDGRSRK